MLLNSKPRLLLHGGMPKTGTKSIQTALIGARREVLDIARVRCINNNRRYGNFTAAFQALMKERDTENCGITSDIRDTIYNLPEGFSVVVSAEVVGVIALNQKALRRLNDYLRGFFSEISVVLYIREPLSYVCSRLQQYLKAAHDMPWALDNSLTSSNFSRIVENTRGVFGERSVLIRSYDSALLASSDVVFDFAANVLGLQPPSIDEFLAQRKDRNFGMTMEVTEALQCFYQQRSTLPSSLRLGFMRVLGEIKWAGTKFGSAYFSDHDRERTLTVADTARRDLCNLMGYDLFPSYRPVIDTTWSASSADQAAHVRNCELLCDAIRTAKGTRGGVVTKDCAGETWPISAEKFGTGASDRDKFICLLGQLYDLCG